MRSSELKIEGNIEKVFISDRKVAIYVKNGIVRLEEPSEEK